MRFLADLHVHSSLSRATSRDLTLVNLHAWARLKGLTVVGTGDVTHPAWLQEIADSLVPAEDGLFRLRPDLEAEADDAVPPACRGAVRFVLQGEVASIYRHGGRVRKVHSLVYFRALASARRFFDALDRRGNVRSDGRPILGLPAREVLAQVLEAGEGSHLVPAHVWTPWFSLLGSRSGFDSVEECFGDLAGHVFALETGLSSDPAMNRRVSALDRFALVSNSDAHSPASIGREANEFEGPLSYGAVFDALKRTGEGPSGFLGTVEFYPEEGKYYLDGHRRCGAPMAPAETRIRAGACPRCGGAATVGVLHRVEDLADRAVAADVPSARPFARLVPLAEVVGQCLAVGTASKGVQRVCARLREAVGSELFVLREAPLEDVSRAAGPRIAEALRRVRAGRVHVSPGFDGQFGTVRIFGPTDGAPSLDTSGPCG